MEFVINDRIVFEDFEMERAEKMKSLCSDSAYAEKQLIDVLKLFDRKEPVINKALDYAKSLDFSNSHLKSGYLSHPLRLAASLVKIDPAIDPDYIVVALLHNVPETTNITIDKLKGLFGENVANAIETLVVDRKAGFSSIQKSYYQKIFDVGSKLVLIKLLDKMDNLFVLGLNPDDEVRKNYIMEVREELLPFAYDYNPSLGKYLDELLKTTMDLGYTEKLKKRLLAYQQSV